MHCSTLHTVSANSDFSCGLENNYIVCLVNITLVVGLVQFQNIKLNISETLIIAFQKKTTYIVFKSIKIMHIIMFFSSSFNENMLTL